MGQNLLSPINHNGSATDCADEDMISRTIRNLNPLAQYYEKSPITLAEQYCDDPTSLSAEELERLNWEGSYNERAILEMSYPPDNEIIKKINERL